MFKRYLGKLNTIARYVLPKPVENILKRFFYWLAEKNRRRQLKNMSRTEGFFEIELPHINSSMELYLNINNRSEFNLYREGLHEPEASFLSKRLKAGDVAYDIGAFVGYFSIFLAKLVGESGHVVSFEPHPESYQCLRKSIEQNHLQNLNTYNLALSDSSTTTKLHLSNDPTKHSLGSDSIGEFFLGAHEQIAKTIEVEVKPLDEVYDSENLPSPDMIKIDTEGAEVNVLNGMLDLIQDEQFEILLAVHEHKLPAFGTSTEEFYGLLEDLPFTPYYIGRKGKLSKLGSPPLEQGYELLLTPDP